MSINPSVDASRAVESVPDTDNSLTLSSRYQAGERDFSDGDFSGAIDRDSYLSYANFRRSKLKHIDWSNANLCGVDLSEADLSQSNLENADLRATALDNSMLFMACLRGANLQGADLSSAALDITDLENADLQGANLCGTYLCGLDLSQVNLKGAYFDKKTQFDAQFDPVAAGMRSTIAVTLDDLIAQLNRLTKCVDRYVGSTIVRRCWDQTRFDNRHLAPFYLDDKSRFSYSGISDKPASFVQIKWLRLWANRFIGSCTSIVYDLPAILERHQLLVLGLTLEPVHEDTPATDSSVAIFGSNFA